MNVTTLQRGPHDTATKSELMDSFLSPVNMTGGVCVRVRGCGRGTGAVRVPVCPIEGAHGPQCDAVGARFAGALAASLF